MKPDSFSHYLAWTHQWKNITFTICVSIWNEKVPRVQCLRFVNKPSLEYFWVLLRNRRDDFCLSDDDDGYASNKWLSCLWNDVQGTIIDILDYINLPTLLDSSRPKAFFDDFSVIIFKWKRSCSNQKQPKWWNVFF